MEVDDPRRQAVKRQMWREALKGRGKHPVLWTLWRLWVVFTLVMALVLWHHPAERVSFLFLFFASGAIGLLARMGRNYVTRRAERS